MLPAKANLKIEHFWGKAISKTENRKQKSVNENGDENGKRLWLPYS